MKLFCGLTVWNGAGAAGQIAEHQLHAGAGRRLQRGHEPRRPVEGDAHGRHVEHDAGNDELQAEAGEQQPREPRRPDGRAPLRQQPGDQRNGHEPDEALRLQ